jgi:hypothetical protein
VWHGRIGTHEVDLAFDHGPLGYLSIAAHGHADALSLSLALDGQPVLVDPGTYLYGSGGSWRSWFRSTPAHNTLNIEGASQSLMAGAFNWRHKARARLEASHAEPDWQLRARHDGYQKRFGVVHERLVTRDDDEIVVTDRLVGADREAEIVVQLAPGLAVRQEGATVTVLRGESALLEMHLPGAAISRSSGREDDPASGWVSPRFGVRLPAIRLAWRGNVTAAGVVTRLRPLNG